MNDMNGKTEVLVAGSGIDACCNETAASFTIYDDSKPATAVP